MGICRESEGIMGEYDGKVDEGSIIIWNFFVFFWKRLEKGLVRNESSG